jgi:adenylate cyclase
MPAVTFASGQRVEVADGSSVLDAATWARATAVQCCGIEPACGSCRMVVLEGQQHLSPPEALESRVRQERRFLPFERLACMAHVHGDVSVEMEE